MAIGGRLAGTALTPPRANGVRQLPGAQARKDGGQRQGASCGCQFAQPGCTSLRAVLFNRAGRANRQLLPQLDLPHPCCPVRRQSTAAHAPAVAAHAPPRCGSLPVLPHNGRAALRSGGQKRATTKATATATATNSAVRQPLRGAVAGGQRTAGQGFAVASHAQPAIPRRVQGFLNLRTARPTNGTARQSGRAPHPASGRGFGCRRSSLGPRARAAGRARSSA